MTKKQRKKFADIIIIICLLMSFIVTLFVLIEHHRLNQVLPSASIASLLGLWGGELLIICIRQIFGSDVITKSKEKTEDTEI